MAMNFQQLMSYDSDHHHDRDYTSYKADIEQLQIYIYVGLHVCLLLQIKSGNTSIDICYD